MNLYGSEEGAQKAAGNELRALNAVVEAGVKQLHVTLAAMFYIRGTVFSAC